MLHQINRELPQAEEAIRKVKELEFIESADYMLLRVLNEQGKYQEAVEQSARIPAELKFTQPGLIVEESIAKRGLNRKGNAPSSEKAKKRSPMDGETRRGAPLKKRCP